jgi:hypothetical protein
VQDQQSFDAIARDVAPDSSDTPHLLLDRALRIRGCNSAYERVSLRRREELIGQRVFEAFPDNPDDSQASGTYNLERSMDTAMCLGATHNMWVQRYDITDPAHPGTYVAKVWSPNNSPVYDHHQLVGVLHRVEEITELHATVSMIARAVDAGEMFSAVEQLHALAAFTAALPGDRGHQRALETENEQLRRALATRDVIGQAKGILMERYNINATAAFALLVELSQETNKRLTEVAHTLIELDHPPAPRP